MTRRSIKVRGYLFFLVLLFTAIRQGYLTTYSSSMFTPLQTDGSIKTNAASKIEAQVQLEDGFEKSVILRDRIANDQNMSLISASALATRWGSEYTWRTFKHDMRRAGFSPSSAPKDPTVFWTSEYVGDVSSHEFSPSVTDGKVFIASWDSHVYALSEFNGTILWRFKAEDRFVSSASVYMGTVFVASIGGYVYALDQDSGALTWNYTTAGEIWSTPAISNGKVFITTRTPGYLYCLDAQTGQLLWSTQIGSSDSSPALDSNMVFVTAYGGSVFAFNETTGESIWNYSMPTGDSDGTAVVSGGKVIIFSQNQRVYVLDEFVGSLLWMKNLSIGTGGAHGGPAIAYNTIFVGTTDGRVIALDESSGNERWTSKIGWRIYSSPAVADGMVFISSSHLVGNRYFGNLTALDAFSGNLLWSERTSGYGSWSSPSIADGSIFVGSSDGKIYRFGVYRVHNIDTGLDYATIQEAIDAPETLDGHIIFVDAGTYYENVVVNKSLTLQGEDRNNTIIDGGGSGDVVRIYADLVNLSVFDIRNGDEGVFITSRGVSVTNSSFNNNKYNGIYLKYASNTTVLNCISEHNGWDGIRIYYSDNNKVLSNDLSNNAYVGFSLYRSPNNTFRNNTLQNNWRGLTIGGEDVSDYYQDVDISNTINGKPIYYILEQNDLVFNGTENMGYLGLVSSENIRMLGLDIYGILLANVSHSTITKTTAHEVFRSFQISFSNDIILDECTAYRSMEGLAIDHSININVIKSKIYSNSAAGIVLRDSSNVSLKYSTSYQNSYGMDLWHSLNNTISSSTFRDNYRYGISIRYGSSNNTLYHNNIINNPEQAYDDGNNTWDDGYPSGGNFWSDYNGTDLFSGPYQNLTGSDGIGDTPYIIDENNRDNYPLMNPYYWLRTTLTVSSDRSVYGRGDLVTLTTTYRTNATGVENATVLFQVNLPNGTLYFSRAGQTNASGTASLEFPLSQNIPLGNYSVYATAYKVGLPNATATTSFTVAYFTPDIQLQLEGPNYSLVDQETSILLHIQNVGNATAYNVNASLTLPSGITVLFANASFVGTIAVGQKISLLATVTSSNPARYIFVANATYETANGTPMPSLSAEKVFVFTWHLEYPVDLVNMTISATSEAITLNLTVTNLGNWTVNVTLIASAQHNLSKLVLKSSYETIYLNPEETRTVTLTINIPATASTGTYLVQGILATELPSRGGFTLTYEEQTIIV